MLRLQACGSCECPVLTRVLAESRNWTPNNGLNPSACDVYYHDKQMSNGFLGDIGDWCALSNGFPWLITYTCGVSWINQANDKGSKNLDCQKACCKECLFYHHY